LSFQLIEFLDFDAAGPDSHTSRHITDEVPILIVGGYLNLRIGPSDRRFNPLRVYALNR
jgi:hypothetical protein